MTLTPLKQIRLPIRNRERWGNWHLDKSNWSLVYVRGNGRVIYSIDLEGIDGPGAMLDWLFQLCGAKVWMSLHDTADLIEAFRDIFDPQYNLCPYRGSREINAPQYLRERYGVQP